MEPRYLARVEAAFLKGAGRGLMLSARDVEIVDRWARAGVPVDVVCGGIDQAFSGPPPSRPVRSLAFASAAVEEAIHAWQARRVGGGSTQPIKRLSAGLGPLAGRFQEAAGRQPERLADVCRWAVEAVQALPDDSSLVEALDGLKVELCVRVLDALEADARATVEARIDACLGAEGSGIPRQEYEAIRGAHLWRELRERFGLPDLILRNPEAW